MDDKYSFKKGESKRIENSDLVCENCVFVYSDRVVDCIMYHQKPISVLNGEDCPKKQAKTNKHK